jgi:GT2 family glycosyltransferase
LSYSDNFTKTTDCAVTPQSDSVAVVIATLGGDTLRHTIEMINQGTIVPDQILICIPEQEAPRVAELRYPNVKVLITACRGQVAQRALGFQSAQYEYILQLDDDMSMEPTCLAQLLDTSRSLGSNLAVAPALIDKITGESVYKRPIKEGWVSFVYYWLMNGREGYLPGRLDKSGSAVGIDPTGKQSQLFDVEWLAGGCILHQRKNLILENYWPLSGKAYYEDIAHSHILISNGVRLLINANARCALEVVGQSEVKPMEYFRGLYRDYLARRYYMRIYSRSSVRVYLYYLTRIMSYMRSKG